VIDIPYPTHVFPLKNLPVPTPKFKRPPSPLGSSVWTASESEIYDDEDGSDSESGEYLIRVEKRDAIAENEMDRDNGRGLGKRERDKVLGKRGERGLVKRKIEKRGLGEFLKHNFAAIVGGVVITAGGLWLWDRFQKKRAEKAAKKQLQIAQNAEKAQKGKQGLHVVLNEDDKWDETRETGNEEILVTDHGKGSQVDKPFIDPRPGDTSESQSETENNVCTDCEHC